MEIELTDGLAPADLLALRDEATARLVRAFAMRLREMFSGEFSKRGWAHDIATSAELPTGPLNNRGDVNVFEYAFATFRSGDSIVDLSLDVGEDEDALVEFNDVCEALSALLAPLGDRDSLLLDLVTGEATVRYRWQSDVHAALGRLR